MKSVPVSTFIATIMRHFKQGGNQTTAARELNVTPAAVCLRIKYLRSIGVKVPKGREGMKMNRNQIVKSANKELKRWM